ncbi:Serine/threonine-protein kinase TOUSLED [Diplonema papillatum]|nr:Serine/threonine-protein kinase TOUSLED [Diplonema papillatum]
MRCPSDDKLPSQDEVARLFAQHEGLFVSALSRIAEANEAAKVVAGSILKDGSALDLKRSKLQELHQYAVQFLRDEAREERSKAQLRLMEDDRNIGRVITESMGGDKWSDGQRPRSLRVKLLDLETLRQEARAQGRDIRKQHGDTAYQKLLLELNRRQLESYKRTEADIREQLNESAAEMAMHIKEIRRARDEAASPYHNLPLLGKERYLMLSLLGRGGFSEVWRACDLQTCQMVAVKVHQLCASWPSEKKAQYVRHARREHEIQENSRHPRVVSLLNCFELNQNAFCTVLEYTHYGDLDSYLKKHKELPEATARLLISQVLSGLAYLHSKHVIHYDLKPANVLFFSPSEVKLTDFGLSKSLASDDGGNAQTAIELTSQGAGTYWYLPPECFETNFTPKVSAKVDVWAAGIVFFQMLFARRPFGHEASPKQLFTERIIFNARQVVFPSKPKVSDAAKAIINRCLQYEPSDRPGAAELLADPYFFQTSSIGPGAKKMQQRAAAAIKRGRETTAADSAAKKMKFDTK